MKFYHVFILFNLFIETLSFKNLILKKKLMNLSINSNTNIEKLDLEKCLIREYASFFSPMEKSFYSKNVRFIDPLNNLEGIDKYQANVDLLAGRTFLGSLLFKDAFINLHNINTTENGDLITRWTLRITFKILPWAPTARFTGISVYKLDEFNKIIEQKDFWDSINLISGQYKSVDKVEAVNDFLSQLKPDRDAAKIAPELPYELLRRTKKYEIRKYPSIIFAETKYDQRPEGYDRLGSYVGGSNELQKKLEFFSPTLMKINDFNNTRIKRMKWPLSFIAPGQKAPPLSTFPNPTIRNVIINQEQSFVAAVARFDIPATEPVAIAYTQKLIRDLLDDGIKPIQTADQFQYIVAQYDALFSLNKRRVEVWIFIDNELWK